MMLLLQMNTEELTNPRELARARARMCSIVIRTRASVRQTNTHTHTPIEWRRHRPQGFTRSANKYLIEKCDSCAHALIAGGKMPRKSGGGVELGWGCDVVEHTHLFACVCVRDFVAQINFVCTDVRVQ